MEYQSFNCGPYNLHTVKTDRFKTVHVEIIFRTNSEKHIMQKRTMLCEILTSCSKDYQTYRELLIKFEELYNPIIYGTTSKTGNVLNTIFVSDFVDPKYISEKNYYEDVLSAIIGLIINPFVVNKEFDIKNFNIVKEGLQRDINSINDNPVKKSIRRALELAFPESATSLSILGTNEELEELSPTELYNEYDQMINHDLCDIFVIGDIDPTKTEQILKKYFSLNTIKDHELNYYIDNVTRKPINKEEESSFVQSSLDMIYNVTNLTPIDKDIYFHIFNYLLGNGGITSKLYQEVREKNSLCYSIRSMYLKYDKLLLIQVSLDNTNVLKAIKLIKKCMRLFTLGKFSETELEDAKNNIIRSIKMSYDDPISIVNNYAFRIFDKLPDLETRIQIIKQCRKEDIISVAKKIKLNTVYNLRGCKNEKD